MNDNAFDPYLSALGERVRALRARKALTRKGLAQTAGVSERHIANVESGTGNASIQFLRQLSVSLNCTLSELVGDEAERSPEWLMIRETLRGRSEGELAQARAALAGLFGGSAGPQARRRRIALIGLRGAGKSTLGKRLAEARGVPFVEINRSIEALAGCSVSEIHSLYGPAAYRRLERRALEQTVQHFAQAVIAAPGGIVSDAASFNLLLAHCYTVWLQASPHEHMSRVLAQGDTRPMAGHHGDREAMEDLRSILESRGAFYAKADLSFDTSGKSPQQAYTALHARLRRALGPV